MPEPKRKATEKPGSDLGLGGFETLFESSGQETPQDTDLAGDFYVNGQVSSQIIDKLTKFIELSVDQKVEISSLSSQLIDNQRQLVATQQILIRLMERSIELTRHITSIEERLPAVFQLPAMFDKLKGKIAQLENIELD